MLWFYNHMVELKLAKVSFI